MTAEELIQLLFERKYPKGLEYYFFKEEAIGYKIALKDIEEQLKLCNYSNFSSSISYNNLTAKEFYNKGIDWIYKGNKGSRKQELIDFAEAYHKHEVDEILVKFFNFLIQNTEMDLSENQTRTSLIEYFKNKLLKQ